MASAQKAADATTEPAAAVLARFVTGLRYEHIPPRVVERAKQCLADAVACAAFGRRFPWSRIVLDEALSTGERGACRIPGEPGVRLSEPKAALVLGAFAHAFELDNLRKPGAGAHPGATVALPALAVAEAHGKSGKDVLTAIVAGVEVLFRIGAATLHTPEKAGFHAPGLTGPFGAAAACASLLGLSPQQTAAAFGIAGSSAGGLLEFAASGQGGMIKRLHLGRASEAGVMAARLAARGYEAPAGVLDGRFGLLNAYCEKSEPHRLTAGLGTAWEMEKLCVKSFAAHVTTHAPVQLLRGFMTEHRFGGDDIATLAVTASDKVVSHHNGRTPSDIMLAQYSVPFTLAIAAYHDPLDPRVFSDRVVADERVRALAQRIDVIANADMPGWGAARLQLGLKDGRTFDADMPVFRGCPEKPLTAAELAAKFDRLVADEPEPLRSSAYGAIMTLETVGDVRTLPLG
jgi:2-methylcitrate dehydratase PrpD